jgi:hypothetical protein
MIKNFNTAMGATSGSAPSGTKGKGGNALIWVLGLAVVGYLAYNFIESRNRMVVQENQ